MLFVNYDIKASKEDVMSIIRDTNLVVESENYDISKGKPQIRIKENGDKLKIQCRITDGNKKDSSFLEGTYFIGKISERAGKTAVKGIILTAPIYHLIFMILFGFFIFQCINLGGISPIPIILVIFDIVMFYGEFKKQRLIKRYIFRVFKIVYKKSLKNKDEIFN